jgi:hypothetical protein
VQRYCRFSISCVHCTEAVKAGTAVDSAAEQQPLTLHRPVIPVEVSDNFTDAPSLRERLSAVDKFWTASNRAKRIYCQCCMTFGMWYSMMSEKYEVWPVYSLRIKLACESTLQPLYSTLLHVENKTTFTPKVKTDLPTQIKYLREASSRLRILSDT